MTEPNTEKLVVFDLETTHNEPTVAEPIQFAGIAVHKSSFEPVGQLEIKIKFDLGKADPAALEVNSFDRVVWDKVAATPAEAAWQINDFFDLHATWTRTSKAGNVNTWCEVAAHNGAGFDAPVLDKFLRANMDTCGWPKAALWSGAVLDTMHLARWAAYLRGEQWDFYNMDALCARYGIDQGRAHDALDDVKATIELLKKLQEEVRAHGRNFWRNLED